jgi:hypothetical protein
MHLGCLNAAIYFTNKGDYYYYEVSRILIDDPEIISSNDLSQEKWPVMNNKTLDHSNVYTFSLK